MGSPVLLKTIKLKMKRDKDIGTEGYMSSVKRATFKDLFYFFYYVYVCGYVCTCKVKCSRGQRHKISWSGIIGSWELPNIELQLTSSVRQSTLLTAELSLQLKQDFKKQGA